MCDYDAENADVLTSTFCCIYIETSSRGNGSGHRCRGRQIFGGARDFWPNFLKLARKSCVWECKFSLTKMIKTFFFQ